MENKLAVLISIYEDEKSNLQKMLTSYLVDVDTDYLSAHYCSIALAQNNYQLQLLKHLEDPLYFEKLSQLKNIGYYENRLADEDNDIIKGYYEQSILKARKNLERLDQVPKPKVEENKLSAIDDFLFKLLQNQLIKPELIFNKKHNLLLQFRYTKKALTLKIPFLKKHVVKQVLYEDKVRQMERIGFQTSSNGDSMVMLITGEKDAIMEQVKSCISQIVFEIFHYSEFKNETFLRFVEKGRYQKR